MVIDDFVILLYHQVHIYVTIYLSIYIYMVARCAFPAPSLPNGIHPTRAMICFKSANRHRDGALRARDPRNCRCIWRLKASILVTAVTFGPSWFHSASKVPTISNRDRSGPHRHPHNCHHLWPRTFLSRLQSTNSHRDRGGGSLLI